MCNAWNHSYSCTCAFGPGNGGWHRSVWTPRDTGIFRAQAVTYAPTWGSERRTTVASFINPNAHCPVCGKTVVFYRSPYNGRIFFDSIGWPWPKHGCTDNGQEPRQAAPGMPPRSEPAWKAERWHPLVASRIYVSAKNRVITGDVEGDYQQLYLTAHALIDAQSPIFARPIPQHPGLFEVTYLSSDMIATQHRELIAFTERLRELGSDVITNAAAGKVEALYTIGGFLLWALDDVTNAMPYLYAAAEGGVFDAMLDLAVLDLFKLPRVEANPAETSPRDHARTGAGLGIRGLNACGE